MPQHKSAEKRMRQTEKRRIRNVTKRTRMKTAIKKVREAADTETGQQELKNTASILDRMAAKGIIHKNKAANLKSKLARAVNRKSVPAQ
ncbi:MAG TPA: 30S ribosomal protein S20 [bacterium]|nr:30S ribosomal protein S20 [bacterium]